MAYEYDEFVDAMRFGITMSDRDTTDPIWNMVDEVVAKTKAFDRIKVIHDKNVNKMSISDTECIEMIGNELERADDEN